MQNKKISILFLFLCLVCGIFAEDLSEEAWSHYRESVTRIVQSYTSASRDSIALITNPTNPNQFLNDLNQPYRRLSEGIYEIETSSGTMCERLGRMIMASGDAKTFVSFRRQESQCGIRQTSKSTQTKHNRFTITGSSLVNGKTGGVIHQRQSFITTDGLHRVEVGAFNPRGDLSKCSGGEKDQRIEQRAREQLMLEILPSLYPTEDDDDQRYWIWATQKSVKNMRSCVAAKLRNLFIDAKSTSIKEFRLDFNFDHIELINVENKVLNEFKSKAAPGTLGPIAKHVIVAHQPSVRMSLSQDDFGQVLTTFNSQKALVVAGVKFDKIRILKQSDDDENVGELLYTNDDDQDADMRYLAMMRGKWRQKQVACAKHCLSAYEAAPKDQIVRNEYNLSQCACRCVHTYNESYAKPKHYRVNDHEIRNRQNAAVERCKTESDKFQVELDASGDEVLAVVGTN